MPTKFLRQSLPNANVDELMKSYNEIKQLCIRVPSTALLTPTVVAKEEIPRSKTKTGSYILIGYVFTESFKDWFTNATKPLFPTDNDPIMNPWWQPQFTRLLDGLMEMHQIGLYHGKLNELESYVMVDGDICMVKPTIGRSESEKTGKTKEELAKEDYMGFYNFCSTLLEKGEKKNADWEDFLESLQRGKIKFFRRHPVFMDRELRYHHYRAVCSRVLSQWDTTEEEWDYLRESLGRERHKFKDWSDTLSDCPEFKKVYDKTPRDIHYNTTSLLFLIKFIDNVMKHLSDEKSITWIQFQIDRLFPGLISIVHTRAVLHEGKKKVVRKKAVRDHGKKN